MLLLEELLLRKWLHFLVEVGICRRDGFCLLEYAMV